MNIFDFEYEKNVRITTKKGNVFFGTVIDIQDIGVEDDVNEPSVSIETSHGIYGLLESEIANIEIVEDKKNTPAHAAT